MILDEWRTVERQAAELASGSPEAGALVDQIERLRFEYRRALDARRQRPSDP
jgi:hypothetical protein